MIFIILAAALFGLWIILSQLRKSQVMKDAVSLQKAALDKGVEPPNMDRMLAETGSQFAALKISIISFCLGFTLIAVPFLIQESEADVRKIFVTFGALALAFAIGNFLIWLLIDRKR